MPTFEIKTPKGTFSVTAPDEQAALNALQQAGEMDAPQPQAAPMPERPSWFPALSNAADASAAGVFAGFDDEIGAGMMAPIEAAKDWYQGKGFDLGAAYTRGQQQRDAMKAQRRENHPVASVTGEILGGLALGAKVGGPRTSGGMGLSIAGKPASLAGKVGAGAVEGAGYGAVYGAGEAKPGERLAGAGTGAAIGGAAGGTVGLVGGAMANRAGRKAMQAATPTSDDLATASNRLYEASEAQGVRFNQAATTKLRNNVKLAAGEINEKLRPLTSGTVDDAQKMLNGEMSLKQIDEFRQGINLDLKAAKGQDRERLMRLKTIVDGFLDNAGPGEMTGGPQGVEILKQARQTWAQSKKTEVVEKILDMAEVKGSGQYTQSGFANAVRHEMRALYKSIQKGNAQGWTPEEIALIRQMASGGSASTVVNLLAKFSPRGPMSIALGQLVGSLFPGVGNIAVPLAGHIAGEAADRAAGMAGQRLLTGAATGSPAVLPKVPNKLMPLIPGLTGASTGTGPSLVGSR